MSELTLYKPSDLLFSGCYVYKKEDADKAIAKLEDKCQMHDFFWDGCGFAKRGFKNAIAVSEAFALQRLSLLRLRTGFAKMCELFFKNQVQSIRDEKFWFRVKHKIIFQYEKYAQAVRRYDASILR